MSYEAETKRLGDFGYRERLDKLTEQIASLDEDIGLIVANLALVVERIEKLEKRADSHVTHMNDLRKWVDTCRLCEEPDMSRAEAEMEEHCRP